MSFTQAEITEAGGLFYEEPTCETRMRDWLPRLMRGLALPFASGNVTRASTAGSGASDTLDLPLGQSDVAGTALGAGFWGQRINGAAETTATVTARVGYTLDDYATVVWLTASFTLNALAVFEAAVVSAIPANAVVFARVTIPSGATFSGYIGLGAE